MDGGRRRTTDRVPYPALHSRLPACGEKGPRAEGGCLAGGDGLRPSEQSDLSCLQPVYSRPQVPPAGAGGAGGGTGATGAFGVGGAGGTGGNGGMLKIDW